MEVRRTVWFLSSQEMNLTSKLHRDLGALITLALGPYEAPFTKASVVVGIETSRRQRSRAGRGSS